jgi:uncharacterized protein YkwD
MTSIDDNTVPTIYKRSKSVDPTAKSLKIFVYTLQFLNNFRQRSNERLIRIKNGESLAKIAQSQSQTNLHSQKYHHVGAEQPSNDSNSYEGNKQLLDKSDANIGSITKKYHNERSFNPTVVEEKEKFLPQYFKVPTIN